jgi:hypothetical protein
MIKQQFRLLPLSTLLLQEGAALLTVFQHKFAYHESQYHKL